MSGRLLRLPSFVEITEAELARVVDLVDAFFHYSAQATGPPP